MAITINATEAVKPQSFMGRKEWVVVGQTADARGNETLLAAEAGRSGKMPLP